MKVVQPSVQFEEEVDGEAILAKLEKAGRTCYKSEDRIAPESARKFIASIIKRGHETVIEHASVTVRVICDRGVTHEIVRHRLASYSQESTRYCDYGGVDIQFIDPCFYEVPGREEEYQVWYAAMIAAEDAYKRLRALGSLPQEARSVLPNSLKTEIVMSANLREWRHFFKLRAAAGAHEQMREVAIPLLKMFKEAIPVVFDDLEVE
jgi:thymidylate synthase (FAD)